jgi:anti-sigma factor RsiW
VNCTRVRKWLPLLADEMRSGGADAVPTSGGDARAGIDRDGIENHLAACSDCREYLEQIRRTRALLHEVKLPDFSPGYLEGFTARVAARLECERGIWMLVLSWLERLEGAPLPTLAHAVAVLATALILALGMPGVTPAIRAILGVL